MPQPECSAVNTCVCSSAAPCMIVTYSVFVMCLIQVIEVKTEEPAEPEKPAEEPAEEPAKEEEQVMCCHGYSIHV